MVWIRIFPGSGHFTNEGVCYVKTPSVFNFGIDKSYPEIRHGVSDAQASGLWADRFDDVRYYTGDTSS